MAIGESKREVRTTWIGFTIIFLIIGSLLLYKDRGTYLYFYSASAFFALFAAVAPMALLPLYRLWVKFAMALAWFNTRLLLAMVFYLVITPIGVAMRLFGKDVLDAKIDREAPTHWKKRKPHGDPASYEKQF
ncbi:hypothetical protein MNBD_NITROSPINAE04-2486 [hydrothermal vent metagenome]|uniref:SxtJ n=1 Tax=hydrothermal vent metagenome TaxID=652676 RepID=A0A3B1BLG3_9ZZZZ